MQLFDNNRVIQVLMGMVVFIIAGSIHEFAHGYSAYLLGDNTAKNNGRLTLNPMHHVDPIGTILFPLMRIFINAPIIGWMRPVPVNPNNFDHPERGQAITAFAGPLSNFLQASVACIVMKVFMMIAAKHYGLMIVRFIHDFIDLYIAINLLLMMFNLIPFPPLDGGWILRYFLPPRLRSSYDNIYRYGIFIIYGLLILSSYTSLNILFYLLYPALYLHALFSGVFLIIPFVYCLIPLTVGLIITGLLLNKHIARAFKRQKFVRAQKEYRGERTFNLNISQNMTKINNSLNQKRVKEILYKADNNIALNDDDLRYVESMRKDHTINSHLCDESDYDYVDKHCTDCENYMGCFLRKIDTYLEQKQYRTDITE